jgi:cobalt-zinc-cadmium efflux system outer membrane protein
VKFFRKASGAENNLGWLSLILTGFVAGCAHYKAKPLVPTQTAAHFELRTFADAGLRAFIETNAPDAAKEWPPKTWDLSALTLAAFYYHPALELALTQWKVTQAGIKTAGGRPNPSVTAGPGYNFNAPQGVNPWLPFVTFDLPVETAGKRGHRIEQAEHLSESARLNIATAVWQVRANLRASLLDFVAAQQREALLQEQLSIQEETLTLLEQRLQAGAIAGFELTTARVALEKTRLNFANARRQRVEARAHAAASIGVSVSALDGVELSFDLRSRPPSDLTSAEVRREALQSRSDILSALAEYAASESALQLEIAKQYPDVHFNPGYQLDTGENKWQLGITVELPVLNQNQGPVAEAEARRAEAAARFNVLQANVIAEIESAVEGFKVSEENVSALESLEKAETNQRESIAAQVKAGAADQLDLLNARLEFNATALVRLDNEIKLQQAIGALENAMQRPVLDAKRLLDSREAASRERKEVEP